MEELKTAAFNVIIKSKYCNVQNGVKFSIINDKTEEKTKFFGKTTKSGKFEIVEC